MLFALTDELKVHLASFRRPGDLAEQLKSLHWGKRESIMGAIKSSTLIAKSQAEPLYFAVS